MRFRCYRCRPPQLGRFHEFEADAPACPKCGAGEPAVIELCDVHFLVPDGAGPFAGSDGVRRRVGCEPKRDVLALLGEDVPFSATPDPRAVTCPSCRGLPAWQEAAGAYREMRALLQAVRGGGCC